MAKTIIDALGIVRRFLAARGFDETDALPGRYDGHAMLAELRILTHAMPESQIVAAIAKVAVHLELGYQFEGEALTDMSANPWKEAETTYMASGLPSLVTALAVARNNLRALV